jgi:hypothetical protein
MDEAIEGRLSRALVQIANARDDLRSDLAEARRAAERLVHDAAEEKERPMTAEAGARFDPPSAAG